MRNTVAIFLFSLFFTFAQTAQAGWVKQTTGSLAWLHTVHFVDANNGWVGGSKGTVLITSDGGTTWRHGTKFTSDTIRKIHFVDKNIGWALCERDIYTLGGQAPSYLMRTGDGGKTWVKSEFEDSNRRRITKLVFGSNGYGIALGEMGTLYGLTDDDKTWQKLTPPTSYLMRDAAFADDMRGAIVGGGGMIIFTEDAGVTWNQASLSDSSGTMLKSVFFVNSRDGWAAGSNGKIYQTINSGRFWRLQNSGTTVDLSGVFFTDNSNGWAVGDNGTILETTTGGNVWKPATTRFRNNLDEIRFFGKNGWIVGFGGTLLKFETEMTEQRRPKLMR